VRSKLDDQDRVVCANIGRLDGRSLHLAATWDSAGGPGTAKARLDWRPREAKDSVSVRDEGRDCCGGSVIDWEVRSSPE
jgi:hypothetical protein